MTWVRIDDRFATHPKVMEAGPMAMALDVAAMCYGAQTYDREVIDKGIAFNRA